MRILLVEDDPHLGPALQTSLTEAGYAVDLSADGVDAEALGDIEPYDLAVLDLGLPERAGIEVLRNWRQRGNRLPVIILTARSSWEEKVSGFKAGADDYLAKPFQIEELLARINAVLKRAVGLNTGPLQCSGLLLNEDTQRVKLPDQSEEELTATEFKLLRYLMMHPGQIVSKQTLTEHVYEYDADRDSNVIEVYINRLRHKIGATLIQTRRGQGYVLVEDIE